MSRGVLELPTLSLDPWQAADNVQANPFVVQAVAVEAYEDLSTGCHVRVW